MKTTIHQPNYLPWLGFFDKISKVDTLVFYDTVQYSTNNIINRNKIRIKDGWMWLTVPVNYDFGDSIKNVRIADRHWRKTHWKSIEINYSKAKYFKEYKEVIKKIYDTDWEYIADLNIELIKTFAKILNININFIRASELVEKRSENPTEALIEILEVTNSETYFSGPDGEKYIDMNMWKNKNLKLEFHKYEHPKYNQVYSGFEPYMCILDAIFNLGPEARNIIIK